MEKCQTLLGIWVEPSDGRLSAIAFTHLILFFLLDKSKLGFFLLLLGGGGEPRELHHCSLRPRTNHSLNFKTMKEFCSKYAKSCQMCRVCKLYKIVQNAQECKMCNVNKSESYCQTNWQRALAFLILTNKDLWQVLDASQAWKWQAEALKLQPNVRSFAQSSPALNSDKGLSVMVLLFDRLCIIILVWSGMVLLSDHPGITPISQTKTYPPFTCSQFC